MATDINKNIKNEQTNLLFRRGRYAFFLELLVVLYLFVWFSDYLSLSRDGVWLAGLIAVSSLDFWADLIHSRKRPSGAGEGIWYHCYLVVVLVVSLAWSLAFVDLMSRLPEVEQQWSLLVLAAFAGAGMPEVALRRWPTALFLLGLLLPICIWLVWSDQPGQKGLALFLAAYGLVLWLGALRIAAQVRNSLLLQFENQELAASLKRSNNRLQELNLNLKRSSATDGLTQVPNRRHFDEYMDTEWRRIAREKGHFSVLMVDVDHFKHFNDTQGHQAGDEVLVQVARALSESLRRPADMVARYGGEEFIVLLPNTDYEGAQLVAEMLRKSIASLGIPHPGLEDSDSITVSIGMAHTVASTDKSRQSVIAAADKALYSAKRSGRNRVACNDI
ncbi:MAG: GGDEF domain-containing protein [Pseudomonadota bacterium]